MQWSDVINDPSLRDLPYKIELNKWGKIEMSPASNRHNRAAFKIASWLMHALPDGQAFTECSIESSEGVKVADVVWCSPHFWKKYGDMTPYPVAPEICVEVISPSNAVEEMYGKVRLYLAQGASEVWLVDEHGHVDFYTQTGKQERSGFVSQLPPVY